jgi:transcriptional regulator with XRE-family HTH domain
MGVITDKLSPKSKYRMPRNKARPSFGDVVRERRRKLDLTQSEVARRIKTSTPYIGHLEAGKRHPSDKVIARLAETLGLDRRELFFLANPAALAMIKPPANPTQRSAWDEFRRSERMHRLHRITNEEMDVLERIAALGEVGGSRDFIYILNTIRHALGR